MNEAKLRCSECKLQYFINSYKHLPDQKHQCLMKCCGIECDNPNMKCQVLVDASHVCPKCLRHIHTFHGKQIEDQMTFSRCFDCFPNLWDQTSPTQLDPIFEDQNKNNEIKSVNNLLIFYFF